MVYDKIICRGEDISPGLRVCASSGEKRDLVSRLHCLRQDQEISRIFIKHWLRKERKKKKELVASFNFDVQGKVTFTLFVPLYTPEG